MRSEMHTQHIYARCMRTHKRKGHKQRVRVPFHPPNIQETCPRLTTGLSATAQLSHPGQRLTLPTGDAQLGPRLQKTIVCDALTQPCHLPTMPQTHVCTQSTTPAGGARWRAQHCRHKNRGPADWAPEHLGEGPAQTGQELPAGAPQLHRDSPNPPWGRAQWERRGLHFPTAVGSREAGSSWHSDLPLLCGRTSGCLCEMLPETAPTTSKQGDP